MLLYPDHYLNNTLHSLQLAVHSYESDCKRNNTGILKGIQSVKGGDLPVAVIRNASSAQQTVWVATIDTLLAATKEESLSPSIIVVGRVVQLMQHSRETLGSAEDAASMQDTH